MVCKAEHPECGSRGKSATAKKCWSAARTRKAPGKSRPGWEVSESIGGDGGRYPSGKSGLGELGTDTNLAWPQEPGRRRALGQSNAVHPSPLRPGVGRAAWRVARPPPGPHNPMVNPAPLNEYRNRCPECVVIKCTFVSFTPLLILLCYFSAFHGIF